MAPESNHTSATSGVRRMTPLQETQSNFISSTYGRCRSTSCAASCGSLPERFFNSSREPITSISPHLLHFHMGKGVPQYRSREKHQSRTSLRNSPNLPCFKRSEERRVGKECRSRWSP